MRGLDDVQTLGTGMERKQKNIHIFARLELGQVGLKSLVVRDQDSEIDAILTEGTTNQIKNLLPLKRRRGESSDGWMDRVIFM